MEKPLLPSAAWKALLCAFALMCCALSLWPLDHWERFFVPEYAGTLGIQDGRPVPDHRFRINAMAPNSPLLAAGVHPGDQVAFVHENDSYRKLGTDELIPIRLFDQDQARMVLVRPAPTTANQSYLWTVGVSSFGYAWVALAIGFLIGWQRADSPAARILSLSIISLSVETAVVCLPAGPAAAFCYRALWPVTNMLVFLGVPYFTLQFPQAAPHWRRRCVRWPFLFLTAIWAMQAAALLLYMNHLLPLSLQALVVDNGGYDAVLPPILAAIVLTASWFSWRRSTGAEKQRVAWIGICFGVLYSCAAASDFVHMLPINTGIRLVLGSVQSVLILLSYVGLGYAILRHRLFDVGFAVNRVLVYSIMSTLLLTLFALTEFAVDKLLHFEGREKNVIFDAAVALGIILTFHRVQHWVNHRVDHVFFHRWQAAADQLRAFVERAPYITEADALQARFMQAIEEFAGARGSAIYWADAGGTFRLAHATLDNAPATIDADDDVAVELRHTRGVAELHERRVLPGDLAFPLLAHHEVTGMLLVGARNGGQAWRPDELALLGQSVPRVCMALEALRLQKLERAVAEMDGQIRLLAAEREAAIAKAALAEMKLAAIGAP